MIANKPEPVTKKLEVVELLKDNIAKVILGKNKTIEFVLTTLFAKGHLLIEDVPGIGKTTLAQALAKSINCKFHRIQFTSDLLPSDITGVSVYNQKKQEFEFKPGPVFANILLADEINRSSPKTQSSLLEAMSEEQVSVDSCVMMLPEPFMVIATQNPYEFYGTFPLPESQLDRFLMRIPVGYPPLSSEKDMIISQSRESTLKALTPVLKSEDVILLQAEVSKVKVDNSLLDYMMSIVLKTRNHPMISIGVSPRGALNYYKAVQAYSLVNHRDYAIPQDFKELAFPVIGHRILLKNESRDNESIKSIINDILSSIPVPL